jgi:hypothetical protein
LLSWLGWVEFRAYFFLDRVRAGYLRGPARETNGRMKYRTETAPLSEYRVTRGCSYTQINKSHPHSCMLLNSVKHASYCSNGLWMNETGSRRQVRLALLISIWVVTQHYSRRQHKQRPHHPSLSKHGHIMHFTPHLNDPIFFCTSPH